MKLNELSNARTAEIELYYMIYVFGSRYDDQTLMQNPTITLEERNRKHGRHETPHEEIAIYFRRNLGDSKTLRNIVSAYWLRKHKVLQARDENLPKIYPTNARIYRYTRISMKIGHGEVLERRKRGAGAEGGGGGGSRRRCR